MKVQEWIEANVKPDDNDEYVLVLVPDINELPGSLLFTLGKQRIIVVDPITPSPSGSAERKSYHNAGAFDTTRLYVYGISPFDKVVQFCFTRVRRKAWLNTSMEIVIYIPPKE